MKHILPLAALTLMSLSHSACRTIKNSNRQQTRSAVVERSDIKSRIEEANNYSRSESLTDSSEYGYQLTIFPTDTFHISPQNGFIGKASKVVLTGTSKQIVRITDTAEFAGLLTSELEGTVRKDSSMNMKERSVLVEKRKAIWQWVLLALIIGVVIMRVSWKFRKVLHIPRLPDL